MVCCLPSNTIIIIKFFFFFSDQKDLATNFVQEYYKNPRRGYGEAVQAVFVKLQKSKIIDPLAPAREQFDGLGSYGNGGAMRIAPITLLCHNKSAEDLVALSKKSVEITHTHAHGINGAILQAFAIRQLLRMTHNKNAEINTDEFLNGLEQKMKAIESDDAPVYCKALNEIARLLRIDPSDEQVVNKLGNSTSALRSVPTAIYCFLKTCKPIDNDQNKNPLRNAIESAITLGGDTDTIASMTGALAGAYYGESFIPENILKHCEGFDEIKLLSEQLYDASQRD